MVQWLWRHRDQVRLAAEIITRPSHSETGRTAPGQGTSANVPDIARTCVSSFVVMTQGMQKSSDRPRGTSFRQAHGNSTVGSRASQNCAPLAQPEAVS